LDNKVFDIIDARCNHEVNHEVLCVSVKCGFLSVRRGLSFLCYV